MDALNIALLAIGGLTLALSLIAGLMRNTVYVLSEPMLAVLLGAVIGPLGFGWLRLSAFGDPFVVVEQTARLTVGVAVVAAALRLPQRYVREHRRGLAAILLPGMVGTWLVGAALAYALLGVSPRIALLVGAIVAPTDPVLAGTIVTGSTAEKNITGAIRDALTAESGANDGLAYPFVFLPILLLQHSPQRALLEWVAETLLWDVGAAVAAGALFGAAAGAIERESSEHEFLEETSLLSVSVALTFATLGGVKLLGSDGILAAFVAGLFFNRFADVGDGADEQKVQETVLRLLTFPVFVLFGLVLPVEAWLSLGGAGLALVGLVLLLRRVPMVAVFERFVGSLEGRRDALFAAWFGPVGIAALYYAAVARRILGNETVWAASTLVIAGSIVVHGATATPLTKLYGRRAGRADAEPESSDGSAFDAG